jgi:membrane protein implicated in regulation of membrane protease activity
MVDLLANSLPLLLFTVGILLTAAEAFIPGAHFIVVGIALMIAGLLGLLVGSLASPLALAATTLVVGAVTFWAYRRFDLYGGQGSGTPMDSASLKGREGTVTERVTPTDGQVKLDGGGFNPYYQARSVDQEIPAGETVVVIDPGGGNVVTVAPVGVMEDDIDRELAAERARTDSETGGSDAAEAGTGGSEGRECEAEDDLNRDRGSGDPA